MDWATGPLLANMLLNLFLDIQDNHFQQTVLGTGPNFVL